MFDTAPPSAGEVRALAHQLMAWADHLSARPEPGRELSEQQRHDLILGLAEAMRGVRERRARIFPGIALRNPNWDIMLDLFIRELSGYRTSLDHLSLAGELPAATVHRAIETLEGAGLAARTPDRFDSWVTWVALSEPGRQAMFELLEETAELVRPLRAARPAEAQAAT